MTCTGSMKSDTVGVWLDSGVGVTGRGVSVHPASTVSRMEVDAMLISVASWVSSDLLWGMLHALTARTASVMNKSDFFIFVFYLITGLFGLKMQI